MGLSRLVVRILTENDHLHFLQRRKMKRIENIICRRINGSRLILLLNFDKQFFIIILGKLSF